MIVMKSWCLAFMPDTSWNAIVIPEHADFTSCLFPGMKHKLYMTCLYSVLFQKKKRFKSKKCLHIVQPPFLAQDPEMLNLLVTIFV